GRRPRGREVGEAADGGGEVRMRVVVEIGEDGGGAGRGQLVHELVRVGVDVLDQIVEARLAGREQVPARELVDPARGELLELVVLELRCRSGEAGGEQGERADEAAGAGRVQEMTAGGLHEDLRGLLHGSRGGGAAVRRTGDR